MIDQSRVEGIIRELLIALGQDLERDDLKETPSRVARMYIEQCTELPCELKVFHDRYDELVIVRDIPVTSFCAHHLLPWFGYASVGYLPSKNVVGISKLARLVHTCCRGFTIQEEVTRKIADTLYGELAPKGCAVVIKAFHTCMNLRGAKCVDASTVTSSVRGALRDVSSLRYEFLSLIGGER